MKINIENDRFEEGAIVQVVDNGCFMQLRGITRAQIVYVDKGQIHFALENDQGITGCIVAYNKQANQIQTDFAKCGIEVGNDVFDAIAC